MTVLPRRCYLSSSVGSQVCLPLAVSLRYPPGRIIDSRCRIWVQDPQSEVHIHLVRPCFKNGFSHRDPQSEGSGDPGPDWSINGRVLWEDQNWCLHPLAQNQKIAAQSANKGLKWSCSLVSIAMVTFLPTPYITTSCEAYAQVQLSDTMNENWGPEQVQGSQSSTRGGPTSPRFRQKNQARVRNPFRICFILQIGDSLIAWSVFW